MATPEKGTEYLDVRKMWKDEAIHFTPWLADHLDMLSDALGVKLELVQREKPVGPFYCDILASEVGSGVKVAIENQLELTDHSHLGQLLTYAAGLDSLIAVWVAPDFLYEHANALHRLNKWTRDEFRFYGVKVMLQRNGDAPPVPCLRPVVTPEAGWNKDLSLEQGAVDPHKQQFHDFFQPIIDRLFEASFADKATQNFGKTDRIFPSRLNPGVGYAASLEGNSDAWVTLQVRTEDKLDKRVFDALMEDKTNIEALIADHEWQWNRYPAYFFSSINIRRNGSIDDPPEKLAETRAWMIEMLPKLKEILDQRVADILKELRSNSDD